MQNPAPAQNPLEVPKAGNYRPRALVADIGGTNMRFALSDLDELTIANYALFKNDLFASPIAALEAYLRTTPERPEHVGFAVAGPIEGDIARLTNRPWSISAQEIRKVCGAHHVSFVNDFEAIALALPSLLNEELVQIGGDVPRHGAAMAVLGPGTGLGVAGLLRGSMGDIAVAGEGGHVSFAPQTRQDFEIVEGLKVDIDFVSAEHLISGPGLVTLYQTLGAKAGQPVAQITPEAIVDRARSGSDVIADSTISLFVTWLGRFAGDVALTFGARAGVYIGGGIAPRILPFLQDGTFREAFEDKGRLSSYLAAIPIYVIATPNAGLKGAALAVSRHVERPLASSMQ